MCDDEWRRHFENAFWKQVRQGGPGAWRFGWKGRTRVQVSVRWSVLWRIGWWSFAVQSVQKCEASRELACGGVVVSREGRSNAHKEHAKDTATMRTSFSVIARRAALTASKRVPPCTTFIKCLSSNSGKLPDEEYYDGESSLVSCVCWCTARKWQIRYKSYSLKVA